MAPSNDAVNALIPQERKEQIAAVIEYCNSVREITISNQQEYQGAAGVIGDLKKRLRDLDEAKKGVTKEWAEKKKIVDAHYKAVSDAVSNVVSKINSAMGAWYAAEQRRLAEERKKVEAEAAERQRKAQERAEREMQKAEQYREQGREEMADKATARAETAIETAETAVAPEPEDTTKVQGTSMKKVWSAEVVDVGTAAAHCLSKPELAAFVSIDTAGLVKLQTTLKGTLQIPGVTFSSRFTTVSRGR